MDKKWFLLLIILLALGFQSCISTMMGSYVPARSIWRQGELVDPETGKHKRGSSILVQGLGGVEVSYILTGAEKSDGDYYISSQIGPLIGGILGIGIMRKVDLLVYVWPQWGGKVMGRYNLIATKALDLSIGAGGGLNLLPTVDDKETGDKIKTNMFMFTLPAVYISLNLGPLVPNGFFSISYVSISQDIERLNGETISHSGKSYVATLGVGISLILKGLALGIEGGINGIYEPVESDSKLDSFVLSPYAGFNLGFYF